LRHGGGDARHGRDVRQPLPVIAPFSVRGFSVLRTRGQADQPGWGGPEAARTEVERGQVLAEVDVEPLAARSPRVRDGMSDQGGGNALPLMAADNLGVEEEGVVAAVPRDINEPTRFFWSSRRAVTQPRLYGRI
jgi:hypothetical protein